MSNKRFNRFKIIYFVPMILFIVFLLCIIIPSNDINKILESKDYNYLPKEAINYIKDYYEETGTILLTEKNKKENVPYLNPDYVDYLVSAEEEKKDYNVIPESLILDYVSVETDNSSASELPETFDLSNVDGNSFISPIKNQMSSGLCWDFATTEQAESYLMVKNNSPYSSESKLFSTRQIDYATSKNGFKNNAESWFPMMMVEILIGI